MKKAVLTIAFDDGYQETYKHAIAFLDKLCIKCTFAVPIAYIGKTCEKRPVVKWRHLRNMYMRGHDIASHTLHHKNLIPKHTKLGVCKANREIISSQLELKNRLGHKIPSFVYPYISSLPKMSIQNIIKAHYASARISKNVPVFNQLPIHNPFSLKGFCITRGYNSVSLKNVINTAINKKYWLIEVFHLVGKKNTKSVHRKAPYRFFMHIDKFKEHIHFLLSRKIEILPQHDVIRKYADK